MMVDETALALRPWAGKWQWPPLRQRIETVLEAEREQLPLWLPVGLGAGIALWFLLPDRLAWIAAVLAAAGIAAAALALGRGGRATRALAWFAAFVALGLALIWTRAERVAAPVLQRPTVATFAATVETVENQPARDTVRLLLVPDPAANLPGRVRVTIDAPSSVLPGSRITLRARLVPAPGAAVPGAYDFARVAWFQRLGATGTALGPVAVVTAGRESGLSAWRARLSAHIQRRLEGSPGGIAAALATGDTGAIPEDDAEAMRRSGLAHLLSVSGLHLTAVVGATMLVTLRLLALWPALALRAPLVLIAAAAAALAGVAYTVMTGAAVPTVRSCVAALLVLLGLALGREALTLRLVAAGALIVLAVRPEALAGASFQLSFAAIVAIMALAEHPCARAAFARREEPPPAAILRAFAALLATGVAVEVALAPIALFHFHQAGLYGALANIAAIPLTTFVIMPLEAVALVLDMAGLGAPVWWLTGWSLAALLWLARTVAAAPGAVALLPAMPAGAFALMVGGGLWLALWRTGLRRWGLVPLGVGAFWAATAPAADILVTGDGRHLALRLPDGRVALLRPRAGDYVRDTLGELAGTDEEALDLDALPSARCNRDLCLADVRAGDRSWRLAATRSRDFVDIAEMVRICAQADILVSDRRLPRTCTPRWLKADRALLARTGGLAIDLDRGAVQTVRGASRHPWIIPHAADRRRGE